jgi:hypothetical protein
MDDFAQGGPAFEICNESYGNPAQLGHAGWDGGLIEECKTGPETHGGTSYEGCLSLVSHSCANASSHQNIDI